MPTITINRRDLESLLQQSIPDGQLQELLLSAKAEIEEITGNELKLEMKDFNRPDLWSVEGIARQLQGDIGILGLPTLPVKPPSVDICVYPSVKKIRPYIACAVIKDLRLTDEHIRQLIQLQEKLDLSYGRKRQKTSIGLYDWSLIDPPIHYLLANPLKEAFIPLGFDKVLTLKEILKVHPKGKEYGWILKGLTKYPLLKDNQDRILSLPPIINSSDLGKVTTQTTEILIEVTGTSVEPVEKVLNIVTANLIDRKAAVSAVSVNYPWEVQGQKTRITPNFTPETILIDPHEVNRILGLSLTNQQILDLLAQRRLQGILQYSSSTSRSSDKKDVMIQVEIPAYRTDIMHSRDIVEEILIAYGYHNIPLEKPRLVNYGSLTPATKYLDRIREIAIGLSLQEVQTMNLTSVETSCQTMRLSPSPLVVEIANPISQQYTILRPNLLPCLLELLSENTHVTYPQKVFECGTVTSLDENDDKLVKTRWSLAIALADAASNFTEIHAYIHRILEALQENYQLKPIILPYLIKGRAGNILLEKIGSVGILGELHPEVLANWGLKVPVAVAEIDLTTLMNK
ncbi:MAG: phenylalanine--tRNA ligase subunit beta [Candidatus Heimdallarchaeota archaeon]|nr:phenylalanine--tRNA ligase subunit beta [Candidatus Heimdallarchaeota archaeon]